VLFFLYLFDVAARSAVQMGRNSKGIAKIKEKV
jgi:hypothetical protein